MKLVDSNVWLALTISTHEFHTTALMWLGNQSTPRDIVFCRATQQSLLRLLTTSSVLRLHSSPPVTNVESWSVYADFLSDMRITFAAEPFGLEAIWQQLSSSTLSSPKIWMDAYLASFAIAGGFELVTTDAGFKQFPGLKLELLVKS